ncbi:MAG: PTS sugar transporter subunit IIA [Erysipelotrichaceae bacterium]|nr:PTS sugar transporter subunit IIA [Erysipelotrichaceae bacterium]
MVDLSKVLVKQAVVLDQEPFESKEEMFDFMASKFVEAGIVSDKQKYIESLEYRETLGPTYMGNYIGLPHGKCDEVLTPGIGFCRCKEPFTYKSCGEEGEVKYVFILAIAGTQTGDEYMRVLATLAGLLAHEDFLELLDKANSYEEILLAIKNYNI